MVAPATPPSSVGTIIAGPLPSAVSRDSSDVVEALRSHRDLLLRRSVSLVAGEGEEPLLERADAVPQLSALLASSLEELKVAEEELIEQRDELVASRDVIERELRYFQALFEHAPTPFLVTDRFAGIRLANRGAAALVRRDQHQLVGKPLATLLPPTEREAFRTCLGRLSLTGGVTNWHMTLCRRDDRDVKVSAAVNVVPTGRTEAGDLMWIFRPTADAD